MSTLTDILQQATFGALTGGTSIGTELGGYMASKLTGRRPLDPLPNAIEATAIPGQYLRGALAGQPGARMSGREMLEAQGMLGANTPGLDWGDAAGLGADVVADPLNLIPIGALSKWAGMGRQARLAEKIAAPIGITAEVAPRTITHYPQISTSALGDAISYEPKRLLPETPEVAAKADKLLRQLGLIPDDTPKIIEPMRKYTSEEVAAMHAEAIRRHEERLANKPGFYEPFMKDSELALAKVAERMAQHERDRAIIQKLGPKAIDLFKTPGGVAEVATKRPSPLMDPPVPVAATPDPPTPLPMDIVDDTPPVVIPPEGGAIDPEKILAMFRSGAQSAANRMIRTRGVNQRTGTNWMRDQDYAVSAAKAILNDTNPNVADPQRVRIALGGVEGAFGKEIMGSRALKSIGQGGSPDFSGSRILFDENLAKPDMQRRLLEDQYGVTRTMDPEEAYKAAQSGMIGSGAHGGTHQVSGGGFNLDPDRIGYLQDLEKATVDRGQARTQHFASPVKMSDEIVSTGMGLKNQMKLMPGEMVPDAMVMKEELAKFPQYWHLRQILDDTAIRDLLNQLYAVPLAAGVGAGAAAAYGGNLSQQY
jgi:hypothetical protein